MHVRHTRTTRRMTFFKDYTIKKAFCQMNSGSGSIAVIVPEDIIEKFNQVADFLIRLED